MTDRLNDASGTKDHHSEENAGRRQNKTRPPLFPGLQAAALFSRVRRRKRRSPETEKIPATD